MSLTEYQVDKLADAFSTHGGSPVHATASNVVHPFPTPSPMGSTGRDSGGRGKSSSSAIGLKATTKLSHDHPSGASDLDANASDYQDGKRHSMSTTFSDLMPRSDPASHASTMPILQRRQQATPNRIQVGNNTVYGTHSHQGNHTASTIHNTSTGRSTVPLMRDEVSSLYSQSSHPAASPSISPMHFQAGTMSQQINDVMASYNEWKDAEMNQPIQHGNRTAVRGGSPERATSPLRHQAASPSHQNLPTSRTHELKNTKVGQNAYSPLMTYFAFEGLPVQKVGGKTMIGEQGWLERPDAEKKTPERSKKDISPKKLGLLDSIKKMAKDMTESKNNRRSREHDKAPKTSKMTISLDPREQSLLFCELEFHVGNAIHTYITNELHHGRLDANKLKKIADNWSQKGRPKVVGFRYDLETQLELVNLHLEDFRFYGRRQGNPVEISGLLHAMKVNARAMSVRTFCQPDSVIAKQLVDSQSLLNLLGCSEGQQISLAEIAQFFKVIVEREQHYRACLNRPKDISKEQFHDAHRDR